MDNKTRYSNIGLIRVPWGETNKNEREAIVEDNDWDDSGSDERHDSTEIRGTNYTKQRLTKSTPMHTVKPHKTKDTEIWKVAWEKK